MPNRKSMLILWTFVLLFPLTSTIVGCSRGSSTIIPDDATYDSLPAIADAGQIGLGSERQVQGMWETSFDLVDVKNLIGKTVPIEPIRTADLHLNVRPFIRTPEIYIRSWNPTTETLDLDVMIKNTAIYNGYDLRLIIFRDTIGHKLLNPDNYTHLWDIPEGTWSNGFIAYAKENQNRILHAGEFEEENLQILCPGGNFSIKFAIDASWPSNCEEPYMMNNFTQGMLQAYQGATSDITVDVYDWQDNVNSVRIQCSTISGQTDTYMTKISGNKWGVELVNNNAVPEGDYFALTAATSTGSIDPLIHIVNVTVSPEVGNGWAQTWGGVGNDYGFDVAVDNDGNIYVTGVFECTVDFNPDPNEDAIFTSNGLGDVFLVKYDQHGDLIWAKAWGAENGDYGQALDVDSDGNVYCGGGFNSTVDFDTGPGIDNKISHGADDCFITKYMPDGTYLWTITFGGGHIDILKRITIDSDNYIYATGNFWSSTVDFDPGPGQDNHSTHGYFDAFVCKFDSDGNFGWARTWGGADDDLGNGVAVDSSGNVYCSGYFEETVDFDPGPGEAIYESPGSWWDAYISSFDSDGNFRWVGTWGSTDRDEAWECAVDEFDDVYVCGRFFYTVDFDPDPIDVYSITAGTSPDIFISKFASDGDFKWVYTREKGAGVGRCIESDMNGNLYFLGETDNAITLKLDYNANEEWIINWDTSPPYSGMAVSENGNSYFCGYYSNGPLPDFDPGPEKWFPDNFMGNHDVFLVKVLPNGLWE